jgi:hypothetical protein
MRTLRPILTSPVVALIGLTALAAWPVVRAGYPSIGDGLIHFYRLVEFDHLLQSGVWFPRWATDLGYGYGYPVFNFYSPLTYYLGALFHRLGLSFADSLLAVCVLALALAVTGTYRLAREHCGPAGALLAAAAYGLSPYLYFNILARGALPETLGLGLLPWVLRAFYRLTRKPTMAGLMTAALLYAGLILTHMLGAVLAAPLVVVFVALAGFQPRAQGSPPHGISRRLIFAAAALGLALLLAAYFLLPAVFETGYVQIQQLTWPGDLDFHNNFLVLSQLFALPRTFDGRLVFIAVPPSLSLAALVLAIAGLALRWRAGSRPALPVWEAGAWVALIGFSLFTLPITTPLWERLPLVKIIQFPWRLVGPASLLLALLAGSDELARFLRLGPAHRPWAIALWVAVLFVGSLTWSFAPSFAAPASASVADLAIYEHDAGQLGTTSAGEFLPRQVQTLPAPDSLRSRYAQRDIIERVAALPAGVKLVSQSASLTSADAVVDAQSAAALTFDFFYFPGWRATVDGKPAPIGATSPQGLITVPVESGHHTVVVQFGDTPLRAVAEALSAMSLMLLAAVGVSVLRRAQKKATARMAPTPAVAGTLPAPWATAAALVLLLSRLALVDGRDTLFARSRFDGATVSGVAHPLDINFDNQLVLIGLDGPPPHVPADAAVPLTLYWRAQNPPQADYSVSVQVVDEAGNLFGQSDSQNPGRAPTSRWRLDQYAQDDHRLTLLPGTPPGEYKLKAGVYRVGGGALDVLDENQAPRGQAGLIGTLTVDRARRPPQALNAAQTINLPLGPLTLLGQTLNTNAPQAGDELRLTLFWQAGPLPRPNVNLQLQLVAADGHPIQTLTTAPARSDYPTSAWASGEVVRALFRLLVPASAPAGPSALQASLVSSDGVPLGGPATLATLDVRVPSRSFALPTPSHPRADLFGGQVKLLGYDLTTEGITLYWQALTPLDTSYAVFVHALDPGGQVVAPADALPANGTRPTTGWLPGEVVADTHALALGGAVKLEVGLYNPQTGERLGQAVMLVP